MNRRNFINLFIGGVGLTIVGKGWKLMENIDLKEKTQLMPALFVGHGSPMNLIDKNIYTKAMNKIGEKYKPKAILVISAHWESDASLVQNSEDQKIIYDFYGFPEELYKISYQANGWNEDLTQLLKNTVSYSMTFTSQRGLDHGTWAVLKQMYPRADIPVIQLSINKGLKPEDYFKIGQELAILREHGVMIIGSGNIVHNLQRISWNPEAKALSWAVDFDKFVAEQLNSKHFDKLISIENDDKEFFQLAHPTAEHYIPLLYVLGASKNSDELTYPCHFIQNASVSMRSVLFA